jgi:glycosyltransferase involved in cell wall biosynthesis
VEPSTGAGGPRHVVQVVASSTGGIGTHVRSITSGLLAAGPRVTVLAPAEAQAAFGFAELAGGGRAAATGVVEIAPMPKPTQDLRTLRRIRQYAARADVVHAHGLRAGALARLALTAGGPPLVVTLHNAVLATGAKARLLAGLERTAVRGADVVLGASGDLVARARALGARDARLAPVATVKPRPAMVDAATTRRELGVPEGAPLLVAVGRLAPQKDYPTLLAAAERWARRDTPPLLVIAGEGPLREELAARISAGRLPVRLLGHRDDLPELLAAADLFVMSSTWEARSLAVQEAMFAGTPVVSTAVGGIPELVGDAAELVPAGDARALAEAVARLLDDEQARRALLARASEQIAGWPDEHDTVAQLLDVYGELTTPAQRLFARRA